MKKLFLFCLVALLASSGVAQKSAEASKAEGILLAMEKTWTDAIAKKDLAAVGLILADEYMIIDDEGLVRDKTTTLTRLKSADNDISTALVDELKVKLYGNVAVVTGRQTEKSVEKGKNTSGSYRYTDVWVKRGSGWQVVNTHESKVLK
jgi:ketosteroid isomerase-like protein